MIRTLFDSPTATAQKPKRATEAVAERDAFDMRDYQSEDADATEAAWAEGRRGVVVRHATGIGKSVLIAELARRRLASTTGKVLIVVDSSNLSTDLKKTFRAHTGQVPGVLTGSLKMRWRESRCVVCNVQALYAGPAGKERYRELDPHDFETVLVDECETSIADAYSGAIRWFIDGNPNTKLMGCSATPVRGDGRGMGELYDYAVDRRGPLNRDILWSVMNGWLVKPRQAFVRCSVDFSTLKLRKNEDGEMDYSAEDIDALLMDQDELEIRRMAEAIHRMANGQPSIVICPNSVEFAKRIAGHICGAADHPGAAHAIYGEQGEYANDLIEAYKRGEFQYAVSVNKLYKGFDADRVRFIFMLRKTRSRRLYEQSLGRGTRPLVEIRAALNAATTPEERRQIIADSAKPWCCMVDLVGVHPEAKDMGVIDIIGEHLSDRIRDRTQKKLLDKATREPGADEEADQELIEDLGEVARGAKSELEAEDKAAAEEAERKKRMAFTVDASVEVSYDDNLSRSGAISAKPKKPKRGDSTDGQVRMLIALGHSPAFALATRKRQAGAIIGKDKAGGKSPDWSRVDAWERDRREAVA